MNKAPGLLLLFALLSMAAHAECIRPSKPATLPDGNTATRDEMVAANKLIKQYSANMAVYLECLVPEFQENKMKLYANTAVGDAYARASPADRLKILSSLNCSGECERLSTELLHENNAAVDEMEGVVNQFNEQLRVFKSRNPQP
jgi:hypothetical protein